MHSRSGLANPSGVELDALCPQLTENPIQRFEITSKYYCQHVDDLGIECFRRELAETINRIRITGDRFDILLH